MSKTEMLADPTFTEAHRRVFVMFAGRDGISATLANEEFDRLRSVEGDMVRYLRVQRTGSKFPLNRAEKIGLALAYDNAGNHASFETHWA